ncbi:MAG: hypothetical protein KDJ90_03395 [Nitratireductor sp.]|nr:hypothetical protein [Nitratireductor sp.]
MTDLLQQIDYREAASAAEKDRIYQLRYEAYRREDAIEPSLSRRFSDSYDKLANCWNFGIHIDNELVAAIRFHVISKAHRMGPALDVFPDIVSPFIESGMTIVDPTRLVVSERASQDFPGLPYVTVRIACMASEYFNAQYCLATVRVEHMAFYKRIFGFETITEPRPYPTLKKPICLMTGDMDTIRDRVATRYPMFMSTFTERRLLFERQADSGLDNLGGTPPLVTSTERLAS